MTRKVRAARNREKFKQELAARGQSYYEWCREFRDRVRAGIAAAKQCPHNHLFEI